MRAFRRCRCLRATPASSVLLPFQGAVPGVKGRRRPQRTILSSSNSSDGTGGVSGRSRVTELCPSGRCRFSLGTGRWPLRLHSGTQTRPLLKRRQLVCPLGDSGPFCPTHVLWAALEVPADALTRGRSRGHWCVLSGTEPRPLLCPSGTEPRPMPLLLGDGAAIVVASPRAWNQSHYCYSSGWGAGRCCFTQGRSCGHCSVAPGRCRGHSWSYQGLSCGHCCGAKGPCRPWQAKPTVGPGHEGIGIFLTSTERNQYVL